MQFHLGRLIDHVHLRVSDLDVSKRFYRAVLASLDLSALLVEGVDYFYLDKLFVDRASGVVSHVHLAFQAPDRATVDKFHVADLAAGGRDNGGPGERAYHPGYHAAFVLDPPIVLLRGLVARPSARPDLRFLRGAAVTPS